MSAPLLAILRQPLLQMRSRSSVGVSGLLIVMFCLGLLTVFLHGL